MSAGIQVNTKLTQDQGAMPGAIGTKTGTNTGTRVHVTDLSLTGMLLVRVHPEESKGNM
jgi:hypothetical protein